MLDSATAIPRPLIKHQCAGPESLLRRVRLFCSRSEQLHVEPRLSKPNIRCDGTIQHLDGTFEQDSVEDTRAHDAASGNPTDPALPREDCKERMARSGSGRWLTVAFFTSVVTPWSGKTLLV
jgi:hypothetical protein